MRVLIADDDAVSRRVLEGTLVKWGYDVVACSDGNEAWSALQSENTPRLAILDWMMPALSGVEVCQKLRQLSPEPYVYVILLTAKIEKEDFVAGLNAGADDYVAKPFDRNELKARLRAARRILDLQAELIAAREVLRVKANYDGLTNLRNRSAILDVLAREFERARRDGLSLTAIMADIDKFKDVNDTFGHVAGDAVLRDVAKRMRSSLRIYDDIGRYGGEEFLVVLPGCDESAGLHVAERIRQAIDAESMDTSEGMIPVSISLGVASTSAVDARSVEELIRFADEALYRAKEGGRNRVESAVAPVASGNGGSVSRVR